MTDVDLLREAEYALETAARIHGIENSKALNLQSIAASLIVIARNSVPVNVEGRTAPAQEEGEDI